MNPRDYDLDELQGDPRNSLEEDAGGEASRRLGRRSIRPDDVVQSNQFRELRLLESMSNDDREKPYLDAVPESYHAEMTLFEWLEFLVTKAGIRGAMDALQYYDSIGWIASDVESELHDYLRSIEEPEGEPSDLRRSDHALSLVYVARLTAMDS